MLTDSYRRSCELYEKTEVSELNRTQSFRVTWIIGLLFVIMWGPWCMLRFLQDWRRLYGDSDVSFFSTFGSSSSSSSSLSPASPSTLTSSSSSSSSSSSFVKDVLPEESSPLDF